MARDAMLIHIYVPDPDLGMKLVRFLERTIGFYDVPELAEWHHAMSRTDKTRPLWVQFRDPVNRRFMEERHNHDRGVCDFDAWMADADCRWGTGYSCRLHHSYYGAWHNEFWPRPPKGCWDRQGKHGVLRMLLLKACDVDDVGAYGPPRREYQRWQWNSGW